MQSTIGIEKLGKRQKNVSVFCLRSCSLPCPVNWNTKQSRVDGMKRRMKRRRCSRCLSPATFTARWKLTGEPASETDTLSVVKWTVTLHFSASWQRRIGRFEPCDVTLIEFWSPPPPVLRGKGAGLISRLQPRHAKCPLSSDQTFQGSSALPLHRSLFHCAASLRSQSLVFIFWSHSLLTGNTEEENY